MGSTLPAHNDPCGACGYSPSKEVTAVHSIGFASPVKSGNQIGSSGRGNKGWQYRNERKRYARIVGALALAKDEVIPAATGKRRLWITRYWGKRKRAFDTDNLAWGLKPLVDELVHQGWLLDDTPAKVERVYKQMKSEDQIDWISIKFEDIDV